jgi:rSAM/selenodomain-associated transferase 2
MRQAPSLSIVLPVLNEASCIVAALSALQGLRRQGVEVIVADGQSQDGSAALAAPLADAVIVCVPGRAAQMNAGAARARGETLLFLHADTMLPEGAAQAIAQAMAQGALWGRFDVEIAGKPRILRLVARMMSLRSRLVGVATGDQGIFVRRAVFEREGGYPPVALMEDIALCDVLKKRARPACLRAKVRTSGRRWEKHGVWKTIFLMWRLRAAFRLGVAPEVLARKYETEKPPPRRE